MATAGGGDSGSAKEWLLLGVLNEALLSLLHHEEPASFWREVCTRARWVVPSQRMAVVLAQDGEAAVVERWERGSCLGGLPEPQAIAPWLSASLDAARASWLLPPWGEARGDDPLRSFLLHGEPTREPARVLCAPLRAQRVTFGALLFATGELSEADQRALFAAATTYALGAAAAFTGLRGRAALQAAGEALERRNAELAAKNGELEEVQAELRRQLDVVEAQHEQLLSLSAPLVEAGEGVLALPMVGVIDERRAARLLEVALDAVSRRGARLLVLDLTGARVDGHATAARLTQIARAVGLLGARCAVSGVSPELAEALLAGGDDLAGLPAYRSLRQALAAAR